MPKKNRQSVRNHLESLLIIALNHGRYLRKPGFVYSKEIKKQFHESIMFHFSELDKLGCAWRIQNSIMYFYNNVDIQEVYEKLFKMQLIDIVEIAIEEANSKNPTLIKDLKYH